MYSWPSLRPEAIVQALRNITGPFRKADRPTGAADAAANEVKAGEPRPEGAER